jgi:hypothetical protein
MCSNCVSWHTTYTWVATCSSLHGLLARLALAVVLLLMVPFRDMTIGPRTYSSSPPSLSVQDLHFTFECNRNFLEYHYVYQLYQQYYYRLPHFDKSERLWTTGCCISCSYRCHYSLRHNTMTLQVIAVLVLLDSGPEVDATGSVAGAISVP